MSKIINKLQKVDKKFSESSQELSEFFKNLKK
jgi:hypothetical protein